MAAAKGNRHRVSEDRKREFLLQFSKETPQIRESILRDLPAFNMLLALEAETFEEIALRNLASERNEYYDPSNPPVPNCPHCGNNMSVGKKGDIFHCNSCKKKFSANYNSISSGTKCDALIWMKILQCMLSFTSIAKTCEYCGISITTFYNIRNKLFHGMQILLNDVKIYGNTEVDNTFVGISFKGMDLRESQFDEDSIFYNPTFRPRASRQRGGHYSMEQRNANNICVFTAIDDRGHVLTRYAGVGLTSLNVLKNFLPSDKFLITVPAADPFRKLMKNKEREPKTKPGDKTIIISDKERVIGSYARSLGLQHESHVYRQGGVQRKLSPDAHNIQRVNALHRRLKEFLRKTNYVSTKYLPGYLILFEFIENTGASQDAVTRLFQILAQPNLGKSPTFYQEMFSVPNYLEEWIDGPNPLQKLPYNKLLSFYLLDHIRHRDLYPDVCITMSYIEAETGYSAPSIRKFYRELCDAGYRDKILLYFGEPQKGIERKEEPERKARGRDASSTLNPTVLAIYDEYLEIRKRPYDQRISLADFLAEKNKQYGTNYKPANIKMKFKYIQDNGIRPPFPSVKHGSEYATSTAYGHRITDKKMQILQEYNNIIRSYREKGENLPNRTEIVSYLAEKYNLSFYTIDGYLSEARMHLRKKE